MAAEFVKWYEVMDELGPCVSIFGSARLKPETKYYKMAVDIAYKLGKEGYGVITGGWPGIMEAGSKGANTAGAPSIGLTIKLPHEEVANPYVDRDKDLRFNYFHIRKVMFRRYAQAFIAMPGWFGTFDELFETLTLVQTNKMAKFPVVLVWSDFWWPMVSWIKEVVLTEFQTISPEDMDLFSIVDSAEEAVAIVTSFYEKYAKELKVNEI